MDEHSKKMLATCHQTLQKILEKVDERWPCVIIEGERSKETQEKYVAIGVSKTLESKHLTRPSQAVDVAPLPLNWKDTNRFYYFAGYVLGVANSMGVALRHGGDWNGNRQINDQTFNDLVHFELTE